MNGLVLTAADGTSISLEINNGPEAGFFVWRGPSVSDEAGISEVIREVMKEPKMPKRCPHGKRTYDCKKCSGGRYCVHGKQKAFCRVCGGSGICSHNKRKLNCQLCNARVPNDV